MEVDKAIEIVKKFIRHDDWVSWDNDRVSALRTIIEYAESHPQREALDEEKVAEFILENFGETEIYNGTEITIAKAICSRFATPSLEDFLAGLEEVLKNIPSTHVPISKMNGKTYHYMCKEEIIAALKERLK